jgi:hypothetical protein
MRNRHLDLEIVASHRLSRPLGEADPVPGCGCPTCLTLAVGGTWADAELAEDIVWWLAQMPPEERLGACEAAERERKAKGYGFKFPSSAVLAIAARRILGALRPEVPDSDREPLPVEQARGADILDVCERLGVDLRKVGSSYRGPCPIHDGVHLNFAVDPERGFFNCFVCGEGGDAIELWKRVRRVEFHEAVREIVR